MLWPDSQKQPLYAALVVILLVGAIGLEVVAVANRMRQFGTIGEPAPQSRQIVVLGSGKVRGAPDVAVVTAGFTVQAADVSSAQSEANRKMTALIVAVKRAGVVAEDIQTSGFSLHPRYVYAQGDPPRITGYEAKQSIEVRIRNLNRINAVLGAAGDAGATNISGLQFTIDDPETLRGQARAEAIAEARAKAAAIARALGVKLGKPVSFQESFGGIPPMFLERMAPTMGMGGDVSGTPVEQGTNEVVANVTVTFELE